MHPGLFGAPRAHDHQRRLESTARLQGCLKRRLTCSPKRFSWLTNLVARSEGSMLRDRLEDGAVRSPGSAQWRLILLRYKKSQVEQIQPGEIIYSNAGSSRAKGGELEHRRCWRGVSPRASTTYLATYYTDHSMEWPPIPIAEISGFASGAFGDRSGSERAGARDCGRLEKITPSPNCHDGDAAIACHPYGLYATTALPPGSRRLDRNPHVRYCQTRFVCHNGRVEPPDVRRSVRLSGQPIRDQAFVANRASTEAGSNLGKGRMTPA